MAHGGHLDRSFALHMATTDAVDSYKEQAIALKCHHNSTGLRRLTAGWKTSHGSGVARAPQSLLYYHFSTLNAFIVSLISDDARNISITTVSILLERRLSPRP